MPFGLFEIPLGEPVLGQAGLQAEVILPSHPGIAMKANLDITESRHRLPVFPQVCEVAAEIDERIGFGFDDIILARDLKALLVPFERLIEVLQLAMDPPDAVRHAREPEAIAVSSAHRHRLVERRQGVRHSPSVPSDEPQPEEVVQEQDASRAIPE